MTNFISIPVTSGTAYAAGNRLINVNTALGIFATAANTVVIYTPGENITLTTTASKSVEVLDAINLAIASKPGGQVVNVELPTGIAITSVAVA
jgi:hypothetical protein